MLFATITRGQGTRIATLYITKVQTLSLTAKLHATLA